MNAKASVFARGALVLLALGLWTGCEDQEARSRQGKMEQDLAALRTESAKLRSDVDQQKAVTDGIRQEALRMISDRMGELTGQV